MNFYWLRRMSCLIMAVLVFAAFPISVNAQVQSKALFNSSCDQWLERSYRNFELLHEFHDFERNGDFFFKANYLILPLLSDQARIIGFECEYYSERQNLVTLVELEPFPVSVSPQPVDNEIYTKQRVRLAFTACESASTWDWMARELEKGNWSAKFPKSCQVLSQGDQFYIPHVRDLKTVFGGYELGKIRIDDGRSMWVEKANLDQW